MSRFSAIVAWTLIGLALFWAFLDRYDHATYCAAVGAFWLVEHYGRKLTTDRTP